MSRNISPNQTKMDRHHLHFEDAPNIHANRPTQGIVKIQLNSLYTYISIHAYVYICTYTHVYIQIYILFLYSF